MKRYEIQVDWMSQKFGAFEHPTGRYVLFDDVRETLESLGVVLLTLAGVGKAIKSGWGDREAHVDSLIDAATKSAAEIDAILTSGKEGE